MTSSGRCGRGWRWSTRSAARHPESLRVRIGIATGPGRGRRSDRLGAAQEQAVVGETPNLAARLQGLAEPDSGDRRDHPPTARRSSNMSPLATEVERFRRAHTGLAGSGGERDRQPLRGAAHKRDALCRPRGRTRSTHPTLEASQGRRGTSRAGVGEPGVGKSRLTELFGTASRRAPCPIALFLLAPPSGQRALSRSSGNWSGPPVSSGTTRPRGSSRNWRRCCSDARRKSDLRFLPNCFLCRSMPLPAPTYPQRKGKDIRGAAGPAQDPCATPAGTDGLRGSALDRPDFARIARPHHRDVERLPVLLIATFRPEFQPPWIGQPHVTTLSLRRLGRDESEGLVRELVGDAAVAPERGAWKRSSSAPTACRSSSKS